MYSAFFKKKNGEMFAKQIEQPDEIYFFTEPGSWHSKPEAMIELTPDNIINEGGFTQVIPPKTTKIKFRLVNRVRLSYGDKLYYREV